MPHPPISADVVEAATAVGSAVGPAAIGAGVAQAFKRGLSYGERLVQMLVGIAVSYFVGGAVNAIFSPSPFVGQAVTFVVAMVAYEATPAFIKNGADVVSSLPTRFADKFLAKKEGK